MIIARPFGAAAVSSRRAGSGWSLETGLRKTLGRWSGSSGAALPQPGGGGLHPYTPKIGRHSRTRYHAEELLE